MICLQTNNPCFLREHFIGIYLSPNLISFNKFLFCSGSFFTFLVNMPCFLEIAHSFLNRTLWGLLCLIDNVFRCWFV